MSCQKKINPSEVSKIETDFEEIIENRDLISILAYEFFINYLEKISRDVLRRNTNLLKGVKDADYKAFELVDKITSDPNIILEELINCMIYGDKEIGNLRTNPDFWIKMLEGSFKISLAQEFKDFWQVFHIRRNASSHNQVRIDWQNIRNDLSSTNIPLWLYSLMLLSYNIDKKIISKYSLICKDIDFSFSGGQAYEFCKIKL